jgi:DNA-binding XRE family transcriptional regulator
MSFARLPLIPVALKSAVTFPMVTNQWTRLNCFTNQRQGQCSAFLMDATLFPYNSKEVLMPTKLTLAKAVKYHRSMQGLSTAAAAKAAGIRPNTWNDIELGRANPRLSTLEAIAFTLGVPVNSLFTAYWPQSTSS